MLEDEDQIFSSLSPKILGHELSPNCHLDGIQNQCWRHTCELRAFQQEVWMVRRDRGGEELCELEPAECVQAMRSALVFQVFQVILICSQD